MRAGNGDDAVGCKTEKLDSAIKSAPALFAQETSGNENMQPAAAAVGTAGREEFVDVITEIVDELRGPLLD